MWPQLNDKLSSNTYQRDSCGCSGQGPFFGHRFSEADHMLFTWWELTRKMLSNPMCSLPDHVQGPPSSFFMETSAGQSKSGLWFPQHQSYPSSKFFLTIFIFRFLKAASYLPSRIFVLGWERVHVRNKTDCWVSCLRPSQMHALVTLARVEQH